MTQNDINSPPQDKSLQNFYQLSCIQTVSLGPSAIILGRQLADSYGYGTAICSIFIGNMVLWLIGIAIVSMVYQERTNAIENIKGYIGKYGALVFAFILTIAFLNWYAVEITSTIAGLGTLSQFSFPWKNEWILRIGAVLGILTSLLAIAGIRFLKWLTSLGFPLLILYCLFTVATSKQKIAWEWGLSLSAIITATLTLLPGTINLPTFFRYSKSRAHSFLSLTLMTFSSTLFEVISIWTDFSSQFTFLSSYSSAPSLLYICFTSLFIGISSISCNLLNIYLASACYETFIPQFSGTKGYAIMGLLGTATYTFIQISSPIELIVNLINCFIATLGIVLLIGVLFRIIIQHRPRKLERAVNTTSWILGCLTISFVFFKDDTNWERALMLSMSISALFFLFVLFIEETCWSISQIWSKEKLEKNGLNNE